MQVKSNDNIFYHSFFFFADDERESQSFGNKDDVNQNEIEIIENDCDSSSVIVIS